MPVLDILTIPDERLKRKAKPVEDIAAVQGFIDDLIETMYHTDDGIGLAATQVGSEHAILVIDLSEDRDQPIVVINPEFVERSGEIVGEEGCLSIPGYRAKVTRFEKVKVKALNRQGEAFEIESDDFLAIVLQHEMDHLDGKVFIEHLSPLKQQIALKKVKKYR
ncbi:MULTISPECIES: peptide deformylase [Shewanella]|uniref:peptide deformylase n=1 Tax=Shewanella TaxID=22 RepID=UPI001EFDEDD8|nr:MULTISPECIES: peptide deformylase [Shewanella]MCG9746618.1 peptide deformylase [Shewanella sp. Isolate8]MCL2909307.1 peptide deformylase [Shewanella aquimarina]